MSENNPREMQLVHLEMDIDQSWMWAQYSIQSYAPTTSLK